ncbi:MAG TPA: DeoR/GlpR family DNA-binding transcription regulator [Baekduia sp.]
MASWADDGGLLKDERHRRILAELGASGRVVATELHRELGVSAYTVRRDLDELAEAGRLKRVHGGALPLAPSEVATTFAGRERQSVAGKREVARAAAGLLVPGQVTILDGGSTALAVAEALPPGYVGTVVTHSPPAAVALAAHEGVEVVLVGGVLERRAMVAVGADCINAYRSIRADMVLLGVWALHAEHGLSEGYREEAEVRRVLLGRGDRVVGLATADKLGTVAPFGFGPADALTDLVTERAVEDATLAPLRERGIAIVRP